MKIYNELESLGFFEWLSETYNLKDTDMKPEYLDELPLNDIHRTVSNSMAFRWFREKYKLNSYCDYFKDLYWEYWIGDITNNNNLDFGVSQEGFKTYEEAQQTCLEKLIEIIKTKTYV